MSEKLQVWAMHERAGGYFRIGAPVLGKSWATRRLRDAQRSHPDCSIYVRPVGWRP